ncbi:hypothetical protein EJ654_28145 [Pseudomonas aeruginosa]|nr:hypothetical protein EJ654_28145 [Pseudomonas aeruginosa]RTC34227.1 hypothetical protein EJ705_24875 [Pseudomonas aeruginosa]
MEEAAGIGKVRPDLPAEMIASFLVNAWEGSVLQSKVEQQRDALDRFEQVVFASFFV